MLEVLALGVDLLEHRVDDAARTAPGSPEVDEHGPSASSTSDWKLASVTSVSLPGTLVSSLSLVFEPAPYYTK